MYPRAWVRLAGVELAFRAAIVSALLACGSAQAAVIFDNLPADGVFSPAEIGLGAIPVPGVFVEMGLGFTPTADYQLTNIEVPLDYRTGPNVADVSVWRGTTEPSELIERYVLTDLLPFNFAQIITIPSIIRPTLSAGEQYWVVLTGGTPTTWLGWAYGLPAADSGLVAHRSSPTDAWSVYDGNRGTLRINGELAAIPEPGNIGLVLAGLLGLASRARARKSQG